MVQFQRRPPRCSWHPAPGYRDQQRRERTCHTHAGWHAASRGVTFLLSSREGPAWRHDCRCRECKPKGVMYVLSVPLQFRTVIGRRIARRTVWNRRLAVDSHHRTSSCRNRYRHRLVRPRTPRPVATALPRRPRTSDWQDIVPTKTVIAKSPFPWCKVY